MVGRSPRKCRMLREEPKSRICYSPSSRTCFHLKSFGARATVIDSFCRRSPDHGRYHAASCSWTSRHCKSAPTLLWWRRTRSMRMFLVKPVWTFHARCLPVVGFLSFSVGLQSPFLFCLTDTSLKEERFAGVILQLQYDGPFAAMRHILVGALLKTLYHGTEH